MTESEAWRSDQPARTQAHALSSSEREILVLLLMSPETRESLSTMLTTEDEQELADRGGSVDAGLVLCLDKLSTLELVEAVSETDLDDSSMTAWHLTTYGEQIANIVNDEQ